MMKDVCLLLIVLAMGLCTRPTHAQDALREVPDPDPQRELEMLRVPEGYEINLFAAEPMIAKPVQMNWDEHGRLWVASSTAYPQVVPGQTPNDKIIVLEDTDGDGQADQSTVFADSLLTPTGLMPGDGGVYVANSTEVLHLKDTDGDGRADERRVVLRGFGQDDTHHLIHTFRWGPEARLYLNQAIYIYSSIETPWGLRRLDGGGIWQLWPQTLELDVFARGFYNPWGHEFDRWGQSFVTDGAGFQGINYAFPGAQFEAAKGAERILDGLNQGHPKYAGLEILSGRHLPDSLHGQILTNDYRANQVNRFIVSEDESGFASEEAGEFVWTKHVAFRPVDVRMGPDGALYLA
ncbi:MAG: PVC-type heme-binding CxxCH protein, partial [Rhodothermales bacterium]